MDKEIMDGLVRCRAGVCLMVQNDVPSLHAAAGALSGRAEDYENNVSVYAT